MNESAPIPVIEYVHKCVTNVTLPPSITDHLCLIYYKYHILNENLIFIGKVAKIGHYHTKFAKLEWNFLGINCMLVNLPEVLQI